MWEKMHLQNSNMSDFVVQETLGKIFFLTDEMLHETEMLILRCLLETIEWRKFQ